MMLMMLVAWPAGPGALSEVGWGMMPEVKHLLVCTVAWHGVEGASASCRELWCGCTGLGHAGLVWAQQGRPVGGGACKVALMGCRSVAQPGAECMAMSVGVQDAGPCHCHMLWQHCGCHNWATLHSGHSNRGVGIVHCLLQGWGCGV
jgi:hypothetical protein